MKSNKKTNFAYIAIIVICSVYMYISIAFDPYYEISFNLKNDENQVSVLSVEDQLKSIAEYNKSNRIGR